MNGICDLCKKETDDAYYRGIIYPFPYYDNKQIQVLCKECYDKEMGNKKIKVKVGDTVIRYDGLKGKVIGIYPDSEISPEVQYENGYIGLLDLSKPQMYYLIGRTVIGNKATEEELKERIADCDRQIEQLKQEKKQLRKQAWRIREEMVEDWRERKALRELKASYKTERVLKLKQEEQSED